MTAAKAIVTVAGCALIGTIIGGMVGYLLGTYAPDFIAALFPRSRPESSYVQIAVGLGTVNGGFIGVGVGVVIMAILAWHQSRMKFFSNQHNS